MRRRRKRLWLVAMVIAFVAWRACRSQQQPTKPTGLMIYTATVAGSAHRRYEWLDLATSESGVLGYEGSIYLSYIGDRRAVWMSSAGEHRNEANGVLRIARGDRGIATHFIRDVAVASVSPDGAHAAMASRYPWGSEEELHLGHFTGSRFEPDEGLGVPFMNTKVHGWFDTRTALVSGEDDVLLRVTPGKPPATVRVVPGGHYGVASHDKTQFARTTDSGDQHQLLHITSLRDERAPERIVDLGEGFIAICKFAPGDRTLGCEVGEVYPPQLRAMLVDTKTGRITALDGSIDPIVFSPDGDQIAMGGSELSVAPIDGKTAPIPLGRAGVPIAWIR